MRRSLSIAVCIPTRNQMAFVSDALGSVFAQTQLPDDVVISDDSGTDGTEEVVERFRSTLPVAFRPKLRYDRSPVALGIGGNFDRAVRLARGDLVVKLDSDDILEARFVETLAKRLIDNPKAAWAHCNVWNIRPDGTPVGLAHTKKKSGFYGPVFAIPAYLQHNDTCHCVLIRKGAYLAAGGYRREMKTAEDWLLWLELLFAGWGYVYEDLPLARMRKYDTRQDLMSRRRLAFIESMAFMVPRVESLCSAHAGLDFSAPLAISRFRASVGKLCVSSACDEPATEVRSALFEAAVNHSPSLRNHLWLRFGAALPVAATRRIVRFAGWPRNFARSVVQGARARLT